MKRALLYCLMAVFTMSASLAFATEAPKSPARQALETSITRILNVIKNPDYENPNKRPPLRQQIEDEVLHIFDFTEFSSRTVGSAWQKFSDQQKKRFSDTFAELLLNTYLDKISGYNGEQVSYVSEKSSSKGDRAEILTEISLKDGKKIPVAYRMMPKDSAWCVYDVLVEGVSLVKNYRTQFQNILAKGDAETLIQKVESKVSELKSKHK